MSGAESSWRIKWWPLKRTEQTKPTTPEAETEETETRLTSETLITSVKSDIELVLYLPDGFEWIIRDARIAQIVP